ncbi:MAG: FHA domain-containing protein [Deltaproteobacteria bacterium]|nr:FHA domain-containing protein [Deltaproteobacteria bacterium]MDQ3299012.1 FHA domain-containing protein [Myxococcota bacterium]
MFKLVIQDDEGKTTVVPLIRDEITIGRKEGNTIRLTERNVSRRHARILRNNGEVQIEDLGSYNGIRVNNARIAERVSLRVSDQVQIGDYKLYLKAEGVEQVDDARTMPIERVDNHTGPTDVIPAMSAAMSNGPTQPMSMQTPAPATLAPVGQLVGSPNRTQVAVADTDPQGRPIASAAAVAAMTTPVGYGKLVVVSSNFAGKEFELSRPQMIIGRTDENDIVINHRSISRNHAKLVREPDTGRYTVSDLQSSNGVRVNGQDYGKVELRRGDVVDLGHVRMRFVDAGEDFVFARDAVITDVPDAGGRRGMVMIVAGIAAVLVVVVAYMLLNKTDKPANTIKDGSNDIVVAADAGDVLAVVTADAAEAEVEAPADAPGVVTPVDDKGNQLRVDCKSMLNQMDWQGLRTCSESLKKYDQKLAAEFLARANTESKAQTHLAGVNTAIGKGHVKSAEAELRGIPKDSVYRKEAEDNFAAARTAAANEVAAAAKGKITANCRVFNAYMNGEQDRLGKSVVDEARQKISCKPEVTAIKDPIKDPVKDPIKDPPPKCDPDALAAKGQDFFSGGSYPQALTAYEQAFTCRSDPGYAMRAFLSSCNSKNLSKAKTWWKRLAPSTQQQTVSVCVRNGISQADLQ